MLRLDSSEMLPGSQKGEEAHKLWAQPYCDCRPQLEREWNG